MPQDVLPSVSVRDAYVADLPGPHVTLFVCSTCRRAGEVDDGPRAGSLLHLSVRAAAHGVAGVRVHGVKCLASCARAPTVAMSHPEGWSYIFGNLDPVDDAAALVEGALLMRGSSQGVLPWRGRPECLKRNMVGRLPPAGFDEEALP